MQHQVCPGKSLCACSTQKSHIDVVSGIASEWIRKRLGQSMAQFIHLSLPSPVNRCQSVHVSDSLGSQQGDVMHVNNDFASRMTNITLRREPKPKSGHRRIAITLGPCSRPTDKHALAECNVERIPELLRDSESGDSFNSPRSQDEVRMLGVCRLGPTASAVHQ